MSGKAEKKRMSQEEFEARCRALRQAASTRGFRVPRMTSPIQTMISVDRDLYELVRSHADRRHISMKSALRELMAPLLAGGTR